MSQIGGIKDAFRQERERREATPPESVDALRDDLADTLSLSEIVRGIVDVCEPYEEEWFITLGGFAVDPLCLHVRIPPPAFFFIEHDTPFVLSELAKPPKLNYTRRKTPVETYEQQIRTCRAAIRSPDLQVDEIRQMPHIFVQLVYGFVMSVVAPDPIIGLIRLFRKKAEDRYTKLQLLEIYNMAKSNNRHPISYLFPDHAQMSPFVVAAIEDILHTIGYEHEGELFKLQLRASAGGAARKAFGM